MAAYAQSNGTEQKVIAPAQTGAIWKTFWILLILTAIEFFIAFTMPNNHLRVGIFATMTIVKAFFIVGEFMHLKHEVKVLIWAVLFPVITIAWLLVALLLEGGAHN
jgi:cytochrome c oxidase subunit IV